MIDCVYAYFGGNEREVYVKAKADELKVPLVPRQITSGDTISETILLRDCLRSRSLNAPLLVTSDYHLRRVKYIASRVLRSLSLSFYGVPTKTPFKWNELLYLATNAMTLLMDRKL